LAAVVLVTLPHERQLAVSTVIRSTVLAPVLELQAAVSERRLVRAQLQQIRAERDSLAGRLLELEAVEEENFRIRALLVMSERVLDRFKPANLYPAGRAEEGVKRSFVLDLGESSGVSSGAAVVAPEGLVGVVRVVTSGQASGDFWTHPDFRVSAMTVDGAVFGIIKSVTGGSPLMQLDRAPFQLQLEPGTELVTSGQGGVFPRGIPIGRVTELVGSEAGWSKSYLVEPEIFPDAVREVMVLIERGAPEDEVTDVWEEETAGEER
jgi:rod shape-determining protein MreC